MATIEFSHITKVYPGDKPALHDLCLEIGDGEFLVIVGPSGCGKSTALRLLAGLEDISCGEIFVDGRRVNDLTPQKRNVAMVFQNYSLYPHMTVRANLEFPLKAKGYNRREIDRLVRRVVEMLGLSEFLHRKPKQLSGGQSQRVAMGRALVRNPVAFLMDEPLSNLDAKLRVQIRRDIVELQQKMATTTLYVTHDQVEAMTLGQRVAVLHEGHLQQVATPGTLYARPSNIFVAGFIGSPGMNLFTTKLILNENSKVCVLLANRQMEIIPSSCDHHIDLKSYLNDSVIVGLRPEAFAVRPQPGNNYIEITVNPYSVERLGHETLVYFESLSSGRESPHNVVGTNTTVARLNGNLELPVGQQLTLYVDLNQIHLFEIKGKRL